VLVRESYKHNKPLVIFLWVNLMRNHYSRGKKLKIDEEIDIHFDPDIKKEPDEPKDYTTSPVQSPAKQKKQPTGKRLQKVRNRVRRRHMYLNTLEEILPGLQTNSG
jgi:hypothetical protein